MYFHRTEPTENFLALRMVSEGGRRELGCSPVLFGRRIRLGQVGAMSVDLDYCAGDDPVLALTILVLILEILAPVDEAELTAAYLKRVFPGWKRRPIDRDPACLPTLRALAAQASEQPA